MEGIFLLEKSESMLFGLRGLVYAGGTILAHVCLSDYPKEKGHKVCTCITVCANASDEKSCLQLSLLTPLFNTLSKVASPGLAHPRIWSAQTPSACPFLLHRTLHIPSPGLPNELDESPSKGAQWYHLGSF